MSMPSQAALEAPRREPPLSVAEQFDDAQQQRAAASLGMWVFLTTETLFFGALFFAYAIARMQAPDAFAAASRHTNLFLGTTNTAVLLSSSFFMALAVRAAITALLGLVFAAIKLTEYTLDYREHLVPLVNFAFDHEHARGALVFFGFYFASTGLHLLHLAIGIALVAAVGWQVWRQHRNALSDHVETVGLYWHFVDMVWIFLYPCLYLVSRA